MRAIPAAVEACTATVPSGFETLALGIHPVFDAITLAIQLLGALLVPVRRGLNRTLVVTVVDAFAALLVALVDAFAVAIHAAFDPIPAVAGGGGATDERGE